MPEANADAIWDSTLSILRRDDTVSQRVMALLTLSRLMAVVADTALLAVPYLGSTLRFAGITDATSGQANRGWRTFLWLNYLTGFLLIQLIIVATIGLPGR